MINEKHFPNIELCKKLKDINYPETELIWSEDVNYGKPSKILNEEDIRLINLSPFISPNFYPCPSVMDMLDVMIDKVPTSDSFEIRTDFMMDEVGIFKRQYCRGRSDWETLVSGYGKTPPNTLAEMILWLVENEYLSFKKSDNE